MSRLHYNRNYVPTNEENFGYPRRLPPPPPRIKMIPDYFFLRFLPHNMSWDFFIINSVGRMSLIHTKKKQFNQGKTREMSWFPLKILYYHLWWEKNVSLWYNTSTTSRLWFRKLRAKKRWFLCIWKNMGNKYIEQDVQLPMNCVRKV